MSDQATVKNFADYAKEELSKLYSPKVGVGGDHPNHPGRGYARRIHELVREYSQLGHGAFNPSHAFIDDRHGNSNIPSPKYRLSRLVSQPRVETTELSPQEYRRVCVAVQKRMVGYTEFYYPELHASISIKPTSVEEVVKRGLKEDVVSRDNTHEARITTEGQVSHLPWDFSTFMTLVDVSFWVEKWLQASVKFKCEYLLKKTDSLVFKVNPDGQLF